MSAIWKLMREVYEESKAEQPQAPWGGFHQRLAEIGIARAHKALVRGSRQPNHYSRLLTIRMRADQRQRQT